MAAQEKKRWDDGAERDLCVAMITSSQDDKGRPSYNWPRVHATMVSLGYNFTKDAMAQHFSKTILKEYKARHGTDATKAGAAPTTPAKAATGPKRTTPASKKRAKIKKSEQFVDEDVDDDDDEDVNPRSAKKFKAEPVTPVKKETKRERERSATIPDNEEAFIRWTAGDKE